MGFSPILFRDIKKILLSFEAAWFIALALMIIIFLELPYDTLKKIATAQILKSGTTIKDLSLH